MSYTAGVFYVDLENGNDGARSQLTLVTVSNPSGSITRCNKTTHGLRTGAVVDLTAFTAWVNGAWKITVVDADNFDLDGAVWQATADASGTVTPRGGSSKADAWKTIGTGATTARVAAGDSVRVMASPDPTLVGDATWNQNSKTLTLAAAVTTAICDCDLAWTPSANVTQTADTATFKQGTKSAKSVIALAFTSGKVAYFATGTLDLSAYQQVSFWINSSPGVSTAGLLTLRLCSDVGGDVAVHTMSIPAHPASGYWLPLTFDFGAALSSSIKSVALWQESDSVAITVQLDNIIACKASSSADALTLQSYVGKVHNLSWEASTAYATSVKRRPTQPNRNGLQYQATKGGTTGATEPAWPLDYGLTVADGSVVWTCVALEDSWFPIQSISGTTVLLDNTNNTLGSAGRGYSGATETVASYRREAIHLTPMVSTASFPQAINQGGSQINPTSYSGGWDRTDMAVQSGETWFDALNSRVNAFYTVAAYARMSNLNAGRSATGINWGANGGALINCHAVGCSQPVTVSGVNATVLGCHAANGNDTNALLMLSGKGVVAQRLSANANVGSGDGLYIGTQATAVLADCLNGAAYGAATAISGGAAFHQMHTAGNAIGGLSAPAFGALLNRCTLEEATEFQAMAAFGGEYIYSQNHDNTAGNHLITTDGGTIVSATDQRHTASGISWKFRPTHVNRGPLYPLRLSVAKIACAANVAVTVKIWTYRDNANIKGQLFLQGGQLAGVPADLTVACEPSINSWAESSALTFTPTEAGVVEVFYLCGDSVGITNNLWVDDLTVT